MSTVELEKQNVIAAFRDLEIAEQAIETLLSAGFEEDELSLLGRRPDEVDADAERGPGEPLGGSVGSHVLSGAATGGLAGGVLGALATAAVVSIPGVGLVAGTGALLGAIGGAGAGSTVGAIVEGESALRSDHSWNQAFDALKEGAVVLGVHGDDPARVAEATRILEGLEPMELRRVNSRGETITPDA